MAEPIALSWSGGKDSVMALRALAGDHAYEVVTLLTTVTEGHERISMHGVRIELLHRQAEALGLPVQLVRLPQRCSNTDYEARMAAACEHLRTRGVTGVAFGDLHLADVRAYREEQMAQAGMTPIFPLWGRDTAAFMREVLRAAVSARIVCLDPGRVAEELAGQTLDAELLAALPPDVDPAGEHGEFHTFVTDAPGFAAPVGITLGERVLRDGFCYQDLLPA